MTKSANIESIEKTTHKPWKEWVDYLDAHGSTDLAHKEIADAVRKELSGSIENPGWWAQSIAVAYEQHIGRRLPGQQHDGTFQAAVSKTIHAPMDEVIARWIKFIENKTDANGVAMVLPASLSQAEKSRHWGCNLENGTRINADTYPKSADTTTFTLTHIRLPDAASVETWRTYWRALLEEIK